VGELKHSPDPLATMRGLTSKGKRRQRTGMGRERRGRGRGWRRRGGQDGREGRAIATGVFRC